MMWRTLSSDDPLKIKMLTHKYKMCNLIYIKSNIITNQTKLKSLTQDGADIMHYCRKVISVRIGDF